VRLEVRGVPAAGGRAATLPVLREAVRDAVVRVATFRETSRDDESVVQPQTVTLSPGRYTLAVTVRDAESGRATTVELPLRVPRLGAGIAGGGLSTPLAVHDARPRARTADAPHALVNVRATAVFGRDSAALVYVEAYGGAAVHATAPAGAAVAGGRTPAPPAVAATPSSGAPAGVPVDVLVRDDRGVLLWRDSLVLAPSSAPTSAPLADAVDGVAAPRAGVVRLPIARLGFGVVIVQAVRRDAPADTAASAVLVALGDELPAATFGEALVYLRAFAAPARLQAVRDAAAADRPARWAALLRATDPEPRTAAHEGLADHVARLRAAAARFGEDAAPGWATDRGRAYLVLGEPDQITDANVPEQGQRGRTQVWEYRAPRAQLVFTDPHGLGRWRLAPAGAAALDAALARRFAP
jgi:GWxTD domain-containing protein